MRHRPWNVCSLNIERRKHSIKALRVAIIYAACMPSMHGTQHDCEHRSFKAQNSAASAARLRRVTRSGPRSSTEGNRRGWVRNARLPGGNPGTAAGGGCRRRAIPAAAGQSRAGLSGAGVLVGPSGLGLVRATEDVSGLAEFGVIFLLFAVGLDLPLQRLRAMWRHMLLLGLAQVALTSLAVGLTAHWLALSAEAALVVGGALALSSTATVLQLLREHHELIGRFGRVALSVLLLQDLAVVPLLALLPLLVAGGSTGLAEALALALVKAAVALAAIMVLGRLVLRPLYRAIAGTRNADILTAANLLIVLGAGWATAQAGMSMALGAFLAGILLAETEYRHQVEADIQPFRGLLLGLFFLTIGMGIDLSAVAAEAAVVGGVAVGLLAGKAAILAGLGLLGGLGLAMAVRLGLSLAQGGEFAFVILGLAERLGVLPSGIASPLVAAVALTMAATPPAACAGARPCRPPAAAPRSRDGSPDPRGGRAGGPRGPGGLWTDWGDRGPPAH